LKRSGVLPVVGLRLKAPLYAYQPLGCRGAQWKEMIL